MSNQQPDKPSRQEIALQVASSLIDDIVGNDGEDLLCVFSVVMRGDKRKTFTCSYYTDDITRVPAILNISRIDISELLIRGDDDSLGIG